METKFCSKCCEEKNIEEFPIKKQKDKYVRYTYCNKCKLKEEKEYRKKNREKYLEYRKQYYQKNKSKYQNYGRKDKTKQREYNSRKAKERKHNDPVYRIKCVTRSMICKSFIKRGYKKNTKCEKILGCSYKEFIEHLLQTYKNNYGIEWDGIEPIHIDHKTPLAKAQTEKDVIKLCHYTNLQLLKAKDNLEKSNKIDWEINRFDTT